MTSSATGTTQQRSRWPRRIGIALGAATIAAVLVVSALVWLLRHLESPSVKPRLQALVSSAAGIELDYASARVELGSGLRIEGLEVRNPAALRAHAPLLARIESIDLSWQPRQLLGVAPRAERVLMRGVVLSIVLDESGKTSFDFDRAEQAPAGPAQPPAPLSGLLDDLLGGSLPIAEVVVEPITCTVLRTRGAERLEVISLTGLAADLRIEPATKGSRARIELGRKDAPLLLEARRAGDARVLAKLHLWTSVLAADGQASLALEARLLEQAIVAAPPVDRLISLEAVARFSPTEHRLVVLLQRLEAVDGAVRAKGEAERPDDAQKPTVLRQLHGNLDAPRLLALVPPGLLPLTLSITEGKLDLDVEGLVVLPTPRLLEGGSARVNGKILGLRAALPGLELALRELSIDSTAAPDETLRGQLSIEVDAASYGDARAAARVRAHEGRLALSWTDLRRTPEGPSGQVDLSAKLESLSASSGGIAVEATQLAVGLRGALTARPPYAAEATLRAGRLQLRRGASSLLDEAVDLELHARELHPVLARPLASRGALRLSGKLGALTLSLEAQKAPETLDYVLSLDAPELGLAARLVGAMPGVKLDWRQMGLALRSKGRLTGLAEAPTIQHDTSLELARPAFTSGAGSLAASALSLTARSSGGARRHEGDLAVALKGARRGTQLLGDGRVSTSFVFDAQAPSLRMKVSSEGQAAPVLSAELKLGFQAARRRVAFDISATIAKLDPLTGILGSAKATRGFHLPGLELGVKARGSIDGLVEAMSADGVPRIATSMTRLAGDATIELRAAGLKWRDQDKAVDSPLVTWAGSLRTEGEHRHLHGDLKLDALQLAAGPTRISLSGMSDSLDVTLTGDPRLGQFEVQDRMVVRGLRQELVPAYPTAELALSLKAKRDRAGTVRVEELRIENQAAGTRVALSGGLDLGEDRRSLSLKGEVEQNLAKLWSDKQAFTGRGGLSTEIHITSGDLRRYRTRVAVRVKDGHVELPRQRIKLEAIDGEIPAAMDLIIGPENPRLMRNVAMNSYSELRFADQHPLQSRRSYLSIARVETPWASVAPLAGNLAIDNNVLSMSQLELGVRGGRISGRFAAVLQGRDTKVELSVRASGVRSSRGEPFDGNASIGVSARQHSVEGRAEIIHIGRRHLLDLLDLVDPPRADTAINRVRRALALGYPDQVRLSFNRGFASAKITFGGLAKLLRIDEIRGIPMGPIVDRMLGPLLDSEE